MLPLIFRDEFISIRVVVHIRVPLGGTYNIYGTQKGTLILRTTHGRPVQTAFGNCSPWRLEAPRPRIPESMNWLWWFRI